MNDQWGNYKKPEGIRFEGNNVYLSFEKIDRGLMIYCRFGYSMTWDEAKRLKEWLELQLKNNS